MELCKIEGGKTHLNHFFKKKTTLEEK